MACPHGPRPRGGREGGGDKGGAPAVYVIRLFLLETLFFPYPRLLRMAGVAAVVPAYGRSHGGPQLCWRVWFFGKNHTYSLDPQTYVVAESHLLLEN